MEFRYKDGTRERLEPASLRPPDASGDLERYRKLADGQHMAFLKTTTMAYLVLEEASNSEDSRMRCGVAHNRYSSDKQLRRVFDRTAADDPYLSEIRSALALNPNCPRDILTLLMLDHSSVVREEAALTLQKQNRSRPWR